MTPPTREELLKALATDLWSKLCTDCVHVMEPEKCDCLDDILVAFDELEAMRTPAQGSQLRAAAERVCWFDWSDNDMDAVAAIDALRKALALTSTVCATDCIRGHKIGECIILSCIQTGRCAVVLSQQDRGAP